jgi:hypothetical protein
MLRRIGNYIYEFGETCEWIRIGVVKMSIDGEYIKYFV